MRPVEASTGICPLLMFNNCLENSAVNSSFCNATRTFVVNFTVFTYIHKFANFKQAFVLSAAVDLGITGCVWRKSQTGQQNHCLSKQVLIIAQIFQSSIQGLRCLFVGAINIRINSTKIFAQLEYLSITNFNGDRFNNIENDAFQRHPVEFPNIFFHTNLLLKLTNTTIKRSTYLQALQDQLNMWRETILDDIISKATKKCEEQGVPTE